MPNYKIGIYKKEDSIFIQLDRILGEKNSNKLDAIDEFTMQFQNEQELKKYLFDNELLFPNEFDLKLNILYKYKGIQKLNIAYKDSKKYFEEDYLWGKLNSMKSDLVFLKKLSDHYSLGSAKYNPQFVNITDIRRYLGDVRANGGDIFYSSLLENAIADLFKKALFRIESNGEAKFNYRGLRDLALFIMRYEKTKEMEHAKQIVEKIKDIKEPEKAFEEIVSFGQISLEDIKPVVEETNYTLSSEGEPIFPPNSEEERRYQQYLDSLPTEYSHYPHER